jgi:hypothetical protein
MLRRLVPVAVVLAGMLALTPGVASAGMPYNGPSLRYAAVDGMPFDGTPATVDGMPYDGTPATVDGMPFGTPATVDGMPFNAPDMTHN